MAQGGVMSSNSANTSDVDAESNAKSLTSKELDSRSIRRVYLITYSQANLVKFPTRRSFADAVLVSFSDVPASIQQWVVAKKNTSRLVERTITWPQNLTEINRGFQVGDTCRSAIVYRSTFLLSMITITVLGNIQKKQNKDALESEGHPDLSNTANCPKTSQAAKKRRLRAKRVANYMRDMLNGECGDEDEDNGQESKKRKRLTAFELSEITRRIFGRERNFKFSQKSKKTMARKMSSSMMRLTVYGIETSIAEFIVNRGSKVAQML